MGAAMLVVVAGGAWLLASTDDSDEPDAEPPTSTDAPQEATPGRDEPGPPSTGVVELWSELPVDHDPYIAGRPGDGPLVDDAGDLTLLYVNSIGRPTLIDVGTGWREELDVAAGRRFDWFEVESGRVVDVSGRDPEQVGPDAVTVRLHRPKLFGPPEPAGANSIDLCLAEVCPQLEGVGRVTDPRVTVLEPDDEIAAIVFGASESDGRFDTVTVDGTVVRIPSRGPGPVWMIRDA